MGLLRTVYKNSQKYPPCIAEGKEVTKREKNLSWLLLSTQTYNYIINKLMHITHEKYITWMVCQRLVDNRI